MGVKISSHTGQHHAISWTKVYLLLVRCCDILNLSYLPLDCAWQLNNKIYIHSAVSMSYHMGDLRGAFWKYFDKIDCVIREIHFIRNRELLYILFSRNTIKSSAVITRCNIVKYCINNCRNWGRISIRCWILKRHPIVWGVLLWGPYLALTGCLLLISDHVITAPHCIMLPSPQCLRVYACVSWMTCGHDIELHRQSNGMV